MNKFKKPYSSRAGSDRPAGRPTRPGSAPRFGAPARMARSGGAAFQKFDAICSNCGKRCQVPFRPDGEKPVYCKDCFGAPRDAQSSNKKSFSAGPASPISRAPADNGGKSIADLTRQIAAMNTKIDTMLKLLTEGGEGEE